MAKSPGAKPLGGPTKVDGVDPRGTLYVRPEQKPVADGGTADGPKDPSTTGDDRSD